MQLRDASPEDASFLAWVMLSASRSHLPRGIWEYLNGHSEAEALAFLEWIAASQSVHYCHYSRFLVLENEGRPAAALCGFDPEPHGEVALGRVLEDALEHFGVSEEQTRGMLKRGAVVQRVAPGWAKGAWVIENVATRPEQRRRGCIDRLLEAMLERGRSLGHERAQIGLLIGNDPARRAYLKHGFQHADEKRDPGFEAAIGCPGLERLLQPF
jgi:GNAT superfamily N-acetyltransferase